MVIRISLQELGERNWLSKESECVSLGLGVEASWETNALWTCTKRDIKGGNLLVGEDGIVKLVC